MSNVVDRDRFHRLVAASQKLFEVYKDEYICKGEVLTKGGGLSLLTIEELLVVQNQVLQEILDRKNV